MGEGLVGFGQKHNKTNKKKKKEKDNIVAMHEPGSSGTRSRKDFGFNRQQA